MKRISVKESHRNSVNCGRKVRARQRRAGRFCAQDKPMFGSTCMHYEVSAHPQAMSFGGIAAVHRLVTKLGLAKRSTRREGACIGGSRVKPCVMCGGTCLEDIERLRHDQAYMNALNAKIPDPTTADFTRRFSEADVIGLTALTRYAPSCGAHALPAYWRRAYIDVDGTTATYGQKKRHLLQRCVGVCPPDRVVGQHQRGAVCGQPSGQRVFSPGGRTLDRRGQWSTRSACPTPNGLFADQSL